MNKYRSMRFRSISIPIKLFTWLSVILNVFCNSVKKFDRLQQYNLLTRAHRRHTGLSRSFFLQNYRNRRIYLIRFVSDWISLWNHWTSRSNILLIALIRILIYLIGILYHDLHLRLQESSYNSSLILPLIKAVFMSNFRMSLKLMIDVYELEAPR